MHQLFLIALGSVCLVSHEFLVEPKAKLPPHVNSIQMAKIAVSMANTGLKSESISRIGGKADPGAKFSLETAISLAIDFAVAEKNLKTLVFLEKSLEGKIPAESLLKIRIAQIACQNSRGGSGAWSEIRIDLRAFDASTLAVFRDYQSRADKLEQLRDKEGLKALMIEIRRDSDLGQKLASRMNEVLKAKLEILKDVEPDEEQRNQIGLAKALVEGNNESLRNYLVKAETENNLGGNEVQQLAKAAEENVELKATPAKSSSLMGSLLSLVATAAVPGLGPVKPLAKSQNAEIDALIQNPEAFSQKLTGSIIPADSIIQAYKNKDARGLAGNALILHAEEKAKGGPVAELTAEVLARASLAFAISNQDEKAIELIKSTKILPEELVVALKSPSRGVPEDISEKISALTDENIRLYNHYRNWLQGAFFDDSQISILEKLVRAEASLTERQKSDLVEVLGNLRLLDSFRNLEMASRIGLTGKQNVPMAKKMKVEGLFGKILAPEEIRDGLGLSERFLADKSTIGNKAKVGDFVLVLDKNKDSTFGFLVGKNDHGYYLYPAMVK